MLVGFYERMSGKGAVVMRESSLLDGSPSHPYQPSSTAVSPSSPSSKPAPHPPTRFPIPGRSDEVPRHLVVGTTPSPPPPPTARGGSTPRPVAAVADGGAAHGEEERGSLSLLPGPWCSSSHSHNAYTHSHLTLTHSRIHIHTHSFITPLSLGNQRIRQK